MAWRELLDSDGQVIDTAVASLPPGGHLPAFVGQFDWETDVDKSDFLGALRVRCTGAVAATVIQTRPGQFATMSAANLDAEPGGSLED